MYYCKTGCFTEIKKSLRPARAQIGHSLSCILLGFAVKSCGFFMKVLVCLPSFFQPWSQKDKAERLIFFFSPWLILRGFSFCGSEILEADCYRSTSIFWKHIRCNSGVIFRIEIVARLPLAYLEYCEHIFPSLIIGGNSFSQLA